MSIFGKLIGALAGSLFGPFGILAGVLLGHLADVAWEKTIASGPYGQETQDLIPLLFSLFGRISGYCGGPSNTQALFLQGVVMQQLQLRNSDQQLALKSFRQSLEESTRESFSEIHLSIASLSRDIYENFFLDRRTLHWIAATCRRTAALGELRQGIIELLDTITKEFMIFEETGSAGFEPHSRGRFDASGESSYEQDWGQFRPSAAAGPEAYATLGLTTEASNDEIKKAYRNLARQHHPDTHSHLEDGHPEKKKAAERFLQIQQAYDRIKQTRKF